jgi:signal transduction histidine kinase
LLGWGGLTVIGVLSSSLGEWRAVLRFALAKVLCMALGLALSHLWRNQLRRRGWFDEHRTIPFKHVIGGLLILSIVETAGLIGVDVVIRDGELIRANPLFFVDLLLLIFIWFVIFLVWTLCYAVALSRRRALRFELEKLELEVSVKDAELRALQAQVNPHFFFNSLNSIRALIYEDADAAALAVTRLAAMMRHNLQAGQADTVRLADELAAVNAYLGMEKLRFDERLQLDLRIAPGLDDVRLPPMVLQTLVENAIKHGVEVSMDVCQVRITAQRAGGTVLLEVANQGRLASTSSSTRLGLANASKRLALLFGPAATCQLTEHDGWVTARVALPQESA